MPKLPTGIQTYIDGLPAKPDERSPDDTGLPSYGHPHVRAATAILLSGRVKAGRTGRPSRTQIKPLCKGSGIDERLVWSAGYFFYKAEILAIEKGQFVRGQHFAEFWADDPAAQYDIARAAAVRLIDDEADYNAYRLGAPDATMLSLLQLFFAAIRGRCIRYDDVRRAFRSFIFQSETDLKLLGRRFGIDADEAVDVWRRWLDLQTPYATIDAALFAGWADVADEDGELWLAPTPLWLEMLDLEPLSPAPFAESMLWVLANHSIYAGSGRPIDELAILCRCCKPVHIDQVFEFRLEPRRLRELTPDDLNELQALLSTVDLPSTVKATLDDASVHCDRRQPCIVSGAEISNVKGVGTAIPTI